VLREAVEELFTPAADRGAGPGAVGVELELIPLRHDVRGEPRQVPLQAVLPLVRAACPEVLPADVAGPKPLHELAGGGRITFEPGGQVEYSGPPLSTAEAAGRDLREVMGRLRRAGDAAGIDFADIGIVDPASSGPFDLLLPHIRYRALEARFDQVGPWGRVMMRRTASMQLNLDFGSPSERIERLQLSSLLVPVLGGAFANSPLTLPDGRRAASGRLWIWRRSDPARTGFVRPGPGENPADAFFRFALSAPVVLGRQGQEDVAGTGRPFGVWLGDEGKEGPTVEDWAVHLTTLFPHVRPRGWLELRFIDTPREEWWDVPIVIASALIYDSSARQKALELLAPLTDRLEDVTEAAALRGVSDPEIGNRARALFELAIGATERMPGYFGAAQVSAAEEFLSGFTARFRTQSDEDFRGSG
jgi:glutamate--cysteine ligase